MKMKDTKTGFVFLLFFLMCLSPAFSQGDCQTIVNQAKNAKTTAEKDRLFRKAAECGDESTQFYLGKLYYETAEEYRKNGSKSTSENEKMVFESYMRSYGNDAMRFLSMAANTGHPGAQAYLCLINYEGHFCEENYDKAREWARKVESNPRSSSDEKNAVEQVLNKIEMMEVLEWW